MTSPDSRLRAAYAAHAADAPSTPHPTPEALAAAIERSGTEAERLATLDHVASCAECRSEFELLRATQTAARQLAPARWRVQGMRLAAAAVVLFAVALTVGRSRLFHQTTAAPDRGLAQGTGARSVVLIAPIGAASPTAPRFVWHRAAPGSTYHIEILDDSGAVVVRGDTRDTTFTASTLKPGRAYRWWVQTKVEGETWQSDFAAVRVLHAGQ